MDPTEAAAVNLNWLLRPVQQILDDSRMTDLHINGPGCCFVDRGRGLEAVDVPYTLRDLEDIAINAAALTRQDIAEDVPLVSTRLPGGHRVQIVRPPAVADGQFAFSIRRPKPESSSPNQLEDDGVFDQAVGQQRVVRVHVDRLWNLYTMGRWREFIEDAVQARLNIVFSGEVGSGKTHNMRAFCRAIPLRARLVTIEDMRELIGLPHQNVVNLLYSKGGQSVASVTAEDLVQASLRMGMDGILNQELRDDAAYAYLNALRSGHWGMTTVHAPSADKARDRIRSLVKQHPAGRHLDDADLRADLESHVDVVVHCVRQPGTDRRYIEQVLWNPDRSLTQAVMAAAAE